MKISFETYDIINKAAVKDALKIVDVDAWYPKREVIEKHLRKLTTPGLKKLLTCLKLNDRLNEANKKENKRIRMALYQPDVLELTEEIGAYKGVTMTEEEYDQMEHITDHMEYKPMTIYDNWYPTELEVAGLLDKIDQKTVAFLLWLTKPGSEPMTDKQRAVTKYVKTLLYRDDILHIKESKETVSKK